MWIINYDDALQGHFVRSRSISNRIASGPGDEVEPRPSSEMRTETEAQSSLRVVPGYEVGNSTASYGPVVYPTVGLL